MNVHKPRKGEAYVALKKINIKHKDFFYLSKKGNLNEVAKNLYGILRKIKKNGYKSVAIEKINNYLRSQAEPDYIDEILNFADEKEKGENLLSNENKDELLDVSCGLQCTYCDIF